MNVPGPGPFLGCGAIFTTLPPVRAAERTTSRTRGSRTASITAIAEPTAPESAGSTSDTTRSLTTDPAVFAPAMPVATAGCTWSV